MDALDKLPVAYARALRLRDAGCPDAEIGRRLDLEPEAVRPLLRLAQEKLARALAETKEAGMYGTVMIAKVKGTREEIVAAAEAWRRERDVPGFVKEDILFGDDGETVVTPVWFTSREEYMALADDPEQDKWWNEKLAPLLEDVRWIDGTWAGV